MKKNNYFISVLSGLFLICGLELNAQTIPNGDLETWTNTSSDTLNNWKGTIGVQKVTGAGGTGYAAKIVTTTASDIACIVSGNLTCISGCSGQVKGVGIPLNGATGNVSITGTYKSSQNGAVVAVGFLDANGVLLSGGTEGFYVGALSAGPAFTLSTVSTFIVTPPFGFGLLPVPNNATQIIVGFFNQASDPTQPNSQTVNAWLTVDNVSIKVGTTTLSLPNNAFENWSNISRDYATGWTSSAVYMPTSFAKSSTPNAGSFAAEISTQQLAGETQSGTLSLGTFIYGPSGSINQYMPGIKLGSTLPHSLDFAYKYTPANGVSDSAEALVVFTKKISGVTTKVGGGMILLPPTNNFTNASVSLALDNGQTVADSALIVFFSSRGYGTVNRGIGSTLLVDDVQFDKPQSVADDLLSASITVSPNPAHSSVTITSTEEENVTISLVNIQGNTVSSKSLSGKGEVKFDLTGFAKGVYLVKINSNNASTVKKLVVE